MQCRVLGHQQFSSLSLTVGNIDPRTPTGSWSWDITPASLEQGQTKVYNKWTWHLSRVVSQSLT